MCLETGGHDLADVARLGDLSQGWEDLTTGLAGRWLGRNINWHINPGSWDEIGDYESP